MPNAVKYERRVNINDETSIGKLCRWIKPGSSVLEFGPASGAMTKILSEGLGCTVHCVEIDEQLAEIAKAYAARMIVGDIEKLDLEKEFDAHSYDAIIFADVLEHLRHPQVVLRKCARLLKPGGAVLASIPNISHAGVVAELMQGEFRYRPEGLLDETHVRFFTRRSVGDLFQQAGFSVNEWQRTIVDPELSEFRAGVQRLPKSIRDTFRAMPDWDTYQFLVRACVAELTNVVTLPAMSPADFKPFPQHSSTMQLYYDTGAGFSEDSSSTQIVPWSGLPENIEFSDLPEDEICRIRIDPTRGGAFFSIEGIEILGKDGSEIWKWRESDGPLANRTELQDLQETYTCGHSFFFTDGDDPQILLGGFPSGQSEQIGKVRLTVEFPPLLAFRESLSDRNQPLLEARATAVHYQQELHTLYTSLSWRITAPLRRASKIVRPIIRVVTQPRSTAKAGVVKLLSKFDLGQRYLDWRRLTPDERIYQRRLAENQLSAEALAGLRAQSEQFSYRPLISIVLPTYNTPIEWLEQTIQSVRGQAYPYWELCIADDASKDQSVIELLRRHAGEDSRIKVCYRSVNGHIAESSNSALRLAGGEFVALLDHDDVLSLDALFHVAQALNEDPSLDLLYSDEDKIDSRGRRCQPTFKPEWSPDYFLSFMYIGHLSVYRRNLIQQAGGFRKGFEGSQDYDLALRVVERAGKIKHIPKVLYHWRMHEESVAGNIHAKPYAFKAGYKALLEAVRRREGGSGLVEQTKYPGICRVRSTLPDKFEAAVVVLPSGVGAARRDLDSLVPEKLRSRVSVIVPASAEFSPAMAIESALSQSNAPYILLLDAAVRPVSKGWIEEIFSQLARPGVAAVAPKIIDSAARLVVNAGYSLCASRLGSNFHGEPQGAGYAARLICLNNVSVLPTHCMAFRREALRDSSVLAQQYENRACFDVDFSLSLARYGRLIVTPYAEVSLGQAAIPKLVDLSANAKDWEALHSRHGVATFKDPYFPEGLDSQTVTFHLSAEG